MCSLVVTSNAAKGMVAKGTVYGVSAVALYAGGKDWKSCFLLVAMRNVRGANQLLGLICDIL
jgi:hypothetical protein